MKFNLPVLFIGVFVLFLSSSSESQEELPFWRSKPKLLKQIIEQRRVVVSVDIGSQGTEHKIRIMGVGAVNVPLYFAKEQIQHFEELPQVSSYFQKVKDDKKKGEVYFFIKAFGQQIRFIQKYQWGKKSSSEAQMDWLVTWGRIKGMVGHYKLRKISATQTEFTIWASMTKLDIPLPQFLINFTLEVIAEKTAKKMRTFMEDKYRKAQYPRENYVEKR